MADFLQSRQQLNQARDAHDAARGERDAAKRKLQRLDAQIAQLQRQANGNNPAASHQLQELQADRVKASDALQHAESQLLGTGKLLDSRYNDFFFFTNPMEFVGRLNDQVPFLLFPVRIETRFKATTGNIAGAGGQPELWVRIYPDDCLIDTFEATLSGTEITAARRYYIESWKAAGIEAQERGAWRGLVGSVGAGRASWILQNFAPLNPVDKPGKATADDVVLVIATDQAMPVAQNAVFIYWKAVWAAKGDAALLNTAYQNLLAAAGGNAALADQIVQNFAPDNIREWATSEKPTAEIALLQFTPYPDLDTKNFSWTQPPKVNLFPDRFVFLGQNAGQPTLTRLFNPIVLPLTVGPDPTDAQQFIENDGDLDLGDDIRWMTDFEAAVQKGLGLKIPLTAQQFAAGFERIFVLGVRLSSDEEKNATDLENLLKNHLYSRSGFALVPQGTPTNNTEEVTSAFNRTDDADDSFDVFVNHTDQFVPSTDPHLKRDGQWFAEWLGLDPAALQQVPNAGQPDQCEARAMNTALWPATWGYYFEKMLHPVLDGQSIRKTRQFFKEFVSARGPVPALRIGRQPYGVLPVAPFRSLGWINQLDANNQITYLGRLYQLLFQLDDIWRGKADVVPQVGQAGDKDPQGTLLHILGLHPITEEIHTILGEPYNVSYNTVVINGLDGETVGKQTPDAAGGKFLQDLGYSGFDIPEILSRSYFGKPVLLHKNVVDDVPPSETAPVRDYTPQPDPMNYLEWLLKKAKESMDDLRKEVGFTDNKPPNAVLYLFLRQALLLAYEAAAREAKRIHVSAEIYQGWKKPQSFIHIAAQENRQAQESESPWAHLYLDFPQVTDRTNYPLAQYITDNLNTLSEAAELREQLAALEHLKDTPTARLERLFREHLDLCHYRLDAWKSGLLNMQLTSMRRLDQANADGQNAPRRGIHIGGYGWLENVKPSAKQLSAVQLNDELSAIFNNKAGQPPLVRDSTNGGYIHAPSLNHAVTAAVLRNGYRANATPTDPDLLSVNLSSERVRQAVGLIEGIRNGQKLGALLGYHFERELHDVGTGLDKFILELRNEFSLNAQKLKTTQTPNTPVEFIEANNVVDGFALMNFLDKNKNNPDPLASVLPGSTLPERNIVLKAARKLFNLADGVADVATAESVHQVVMGNYERAAATMDAYAAANLPPEPEVVRTPRSGHTLTHRVGIHLKAGATAGPADNPRRQAEPSLNDWLSEHLPTSTSLGVVVRYHDAAGNPVRRFVTQSELGLAPIDLLFTVNEAATQAATELDDLVLAHVAATATLRPDAKIELAFTEAEPGKITLFEAAPLLASLRSLTLRSRPLAATDVQLPGEASDSKAGEIRLEKSRIEAVMTAMNTMKTAVSNFIAALQPDADGDMLDNLDAHLTQFGLISAGANLFGLPHAGFAMSWQNRSDIYTVLRDKLTKLTQRWTQNLADSRAITTALPAPVEADVPQIQEAGRLVSTALLPADLLPPALRTEVINRQNTFEAKLTALSNLLNNPPNALADFHEQFSLQLPLTDFDPVEFSIADQTAAMQSLLDQWLTRVQALVAEINRRLALATTQLTAHDASADAVQRVKILQEAGKTLLNDDFRMIPSFKTTVAAGFEWKNALDNSDNLLNYVQTRPDNPLPLPVDEWLHGTARVREKMFHFENTVLLTGAFGQTEPVLQPAQLPFRAGEDWLALEFDPDNSANTLEVERLLYTAHYSETFQPANWQCGLLVDEWTEVIPQKEEVTGLAFHFDRPNAEPPQVWLLAMPAEFTGEWRWDDLVASLNQTLDDARARAVEPEHLGQKFAALLPAVLTESSWSPMTINANIIARAAKVAQAFINP